MLALEEAGGPQRAMARGLGGTQNVSAQAAPSATASAPQLPSVSSVHPLRRAASFSSADRQSAQRHWQTTLRDRLGTPGEAPGRDQLPSLYDRPSYISAMRPPTSNSAPPSTAGPSASIVAWFAQFRCESCGRIPLSLDAKFCSSCGYPLEIKVPTELQAQAQAAAAGGSQASKAKPVEEKQNATGAREGDVRLRARSFGAAHKGADRRDRALDAAQRAATGLLAPRADRRMKGLPSRPSRAPEAGSQLPWSQRESQVALWLDNIKPRIP